MRELGAATVALDVVFSEPDRTGPTGFLRQLRERDWPGRESLEAMLARIPDNDAVLAESIRQMPTVLGFFSEATSKLGLPQVKAGFAFLGADPTPALPVMEASVPSLPIFQDAAAGQGSITLGQQQDDVVRRAPMFISDGRKIHPAMAIEALRVVLGRPSFTIRTTEASGEIGAGKLELTHFRLGDFEVPVDGSGNFLIYYAKRSPDMFVSARDILNRTDAELAPLSRATWFLSVPRPSVFATSVSRRWARACPACSCMRRSPTRSCPANSFPVRTGHKAPRSRQ